MIDQQTLETRLAGLQQQRDQERSRLLQLQTATRQAETACAQLDGAIMVLQHLLHPEPAQTSPNGDAPAPE